MKKSFLFLSLWVGQIWALSCSTPVTLSQSGLSHYKPKVAMNESGEAVALWIAEKDEEDEMLERILFAATMNAEKKWSACSAISQPLLRVSSHQPFIDEQGNIYAFWKNIDKEISRVEQEEGFTIEITESEISDHLSKKEKNNSWSLMDDDAWNSMGKNFSPNKLVLHNQENLLFLGSIFNDSQKIGIGVLQYLPQSNKKKLTVFSDDVGVRSEEYFVKHKEGLTFALWSESKSKTDKDEKSITLKGTWSQNGSSWSDPFIVHKMNGRVGDFRKIRGMMNSSQDAVVLWEYYDHVEGISKLQAATYFDREWSEPADFATAHHFFYGLKVILNDAGDIVTTWSVSQEKKGMIYVAEKAKGQPWSSPIALFTKDTPETEIALDNKGNILIVWLVEEEKERWVVHAAYKPKGQHWSSPVALSNRAAECEHFSKIMTDSAGHFIVVWDEQQNDHSSIHGATLSTKTWQWSSALLSPEGLDCDRCTIALNGKGQGVVAWRMEDNSEMTHIQAVQLKIN